MTGQFRSMPRDHASINTTERTRLDLLVRSQYIYKHISINMSKQHVVTKYQERVYAALQQIPEGRIASYASMARALKSSPRAVGGALRVNPFAPVIPCHRCIASTGVSLRDFIRQHMLTRAVRRRLQRRLGESSVRPEPEFQA